MPKAATIDGRIIAIQEGRFRLLTPDGRGFLFTLAHNANVDTLTLGQWHRHDLPVRVTYSGEPGLESCKVRSVEPLPSEGKDEAKQVGQRWRRDAE